jgi:HPt (histidine-containing phosphotransfer) domain-containing protein
MSLDENEFDTGALPRLERMVGSTVLVEVLALYLENTPQRVEAVRAGLRSGDHEIVARALHDLKSSAGMVGASGVMRLAETMERLARANESESLPERLEQLEAALARAETLLNEAIKRRDV